MPHLQYFNSKGTRGGVWTQCIIAFSHPNIDLGLQFRNSQIRCKLNSMGNNNLLNVPSYSGDTLYNPDNGNRMLKSSFNEGLNINSQHQYEHTGVNYCHVWKGRCQHYYSPNSLRKYFRRCLYRCAFRWQNRWIIPFILLESGNGRLSKRYV